MLSDTAKLAVQLDLTGSFDKKVAGAQKSVAGLGGRIKALGAEAKGSILQGVGLGAGAAGFGLLSAGISSAIDFMGGAIEKASDMAETQSKLSLVFKDSADTVREWAQDANRAMGTTEQSALEAAGSLGNFLQAMGTAETDAARMSTSLVTLAADLASFNNAAGGTEEVLLAIQSGLSGETEPLRRFGVDISDVAVQAELLASGVKKVGGAFTQTQKIQGRYNIIFRQTKTAQGDFLRTSDGLANSQRILAATVDDLQRKFGEQLLPIYQAVVTFVTVNLVPAIDTVAKAFRDTTTALDDLRTKAGEVFGRDIGNDLSNLSRVVATGGLVVLSDAAGDVGFALEDAGRALDDFDGARGRVDWAALLSVFRESSDAIHQTGEALEQTAEEAAAAAAEAEKLRARQVLLARATLNYRRVAQATSTAIREMAGSVDIAKGSFSGFWKQVRADQARIRYFIRHPGLLRRETERLEATLADLEQRRVAIERGGISRRERLQYQAVTNLIAMLRTRRSELFGVGLTLGDAAEKGMERGFSPALAGKINAVFGGVGGAIPIRRRRRRKGKNAAQGGTYLPGDWGMVGEDGPEHIANLGGVTVIEPMRGARSERMMVPIVIHTTITAHQIVRQTDRVVSGNRRIAS